MARLVTGLDPGRVRARFEEARERVAAACAKAGRTAGDVELLAATKYVPAEELGALAAGYEAVRFAGLMTMPPLAAEPEAARPYFAALRELAEQLTPKWGPEHDFSVLSMGTSQDYGVAVEEGATICRLGTVLYG